jgi:hypothetical protein
MADIAEPKEVTGAPVYKPATCGNCLRTADRQASRHRASLMCRPPCGPEGSREDAVRATEAGSRRAVGRGIGCIRATRATTRVTGSPRASVAVRWDEGDEDGEARQGQLPGLYSAREESKRYDT